MSLFSSRKQILILSTMAILAAGLWLAQPQPLPAAPEGGIPHATVTLVSATPAIAAHQDFLLGVHFAMQPGWHIYWANPGDSGEPPRLIWNLPEGMSAGAIAWPVPKRLPAPSVMDFGYTGNVTLMVPVHNSSALASGTANLGLQVKAVICREVCIPGHTQLSLSLPVGATAGEASPADRALFDTAKRDLPRPMPEDWSAKATQTKQDLLLAVNTHHPVTSAVFFPLDEEQLDDDAPQPLRKAAAGFRLQLKKSDQLMKPADRLRGVLVVNGAGYHVDLPVAPAAK